MQYVDQLNFVALGNIGNICFGLQAKMQGGMVGFLSINMAHYNNYK
jgi:hypothetical protein